MVTTLLMASDGTSLSMRKRDKVKSLFRSRSSEPPTPAPGPSSGHGPALATTPTAVPASSSAPIPAPASAPSSALAPASPPSQSKAESKPLKTSQSLWDKAFEKLRNGDADLILKYETLLAATVSSNQPFNTSGVTSTATATNSQNLDKLIDLANKKSGDHFQLAGYNVQEMLAKTAEFVDWAKDWIDQAVQVSPQASLAWSIISLGIPFLTNPAAAEKDCKEGFTYTISRMLYYVALETGMSDLGDHMEPIIIELYKVVLDYQIHAVLRFNRRTITNIGRDILQLEDWKSMLAIIQFQEAQLYQSTLQSSSLSLNSKLSELIDSAVADNTQMKNMISIAEQQLESLGHTEIHTKDTAENTKRSADLNQKRFDREITEEEMKCLQSFRLSDTSGDDHSYEAFKKQNERREAGTCLWITNHPEFTKWLSQDSGSLLVTADPGCGKSVLAAYLINDVLPKPVYYFFFKDQVQNRTYQALCALLHQILSQDNSLIKLVLPLYRANDQKLTSNVTLLWQLLLEVIEKHGALSIVLDALDECTESDRSGTNGFLASLLNLNKTKARLLFTSRPHTSVTDEIPSETSIRIHGEDLSNEISPEINRVIEARVFKIARKKNLPAKITDHIREKLLKVPQRTYLWVYLVLDYLELGFKQTATGFDKHIEQLPLTVTAAYEQILSTCGPSDTASITRIILNLILAARRPLRVVELQIAVEMVKDPDIRTLPEIDLEDEERFKAMIRQKCGLLITIQDDEVYFLHQTVREFLIGKSSTAHWQESFSESQANSLLTCVCFDYLHLSDFLEALWNLEFKDERPDIPDGNSIELEATERRMKFASYAWNEWHEHYKLVEQLESLPTTLDQRAFNICCWAAAVSAELDKGEECAKKTIDLNAIKTSKHKGCLLMAVELDIARLIPLCLRVADINMLDEFDEPALAKAIRSENEDLVRELVLHGASVDTGTAIGSRALHDIIGSSMTHLLPMMCERSLAIDAENLWGKTALEEAIDLFLQKPDALVLVECLLEHKASVHTKNRLGDPVFHKIVQRGPLSLVQLFVSHGADPLDTNNTGQTALHVAASRLDEDGVEILKYLLTLNPDLGAKANARQRSLHIAADSDLSQVSGAPPPKGPNTDEPDNFGQTALSVVATSTNEGCIVTSSDKLPGRYVDTKDNHGRTPMFRILSPDQERKIEGYVYASTMATLLHTAGASFDVRDDEGLTVIHTMIDGILMLAINVWQTESLLERLNELLNKLISFGADLNVADKRSDTPILRSLRSVREPILLPLAANLARILQQSGADPTISGANGRTAIHRVLRNRKLCRSFIADKSEVAEDNLSQKVGISSDHRAMDARNLLSLLEWLVTSGVDIEARDDSGKTALDYARKQNLYDEIVQGMEALALKGSSVTKDLSSKGREGNGTPSI